MNQQVANPIEIRASKIAQSAIRYEPDKNKRSPVWDRAIDKEFKFSSATAADRNTAPPPTFLPVMVAVYVRSPLGIFNHRNVILPRFYHSLDILPFSSLHPISFFFFFFCYFSLCFYFAFLLSTIGEQCFSGLRFKREQGWLVYCQFFYRAGEKSLSTKIRKLFGIYSFSFL